MSEMEIFEAMRFMADESHNGVFVPEWARQKILAGRLDELEIKTVKIGNYQVNYLVEKEANNEH